MRCKRAFLKLNNRGSGLVTVLVCILLLAVMGSVIMMLSYTGYEMRVSERKGKETFYDAAAVVEQIEAGVQVVVSDSISKAYSAALVDYSYMSEGISGRFAQTYREAVLSWTDEEGSALFSGDDAAYLYEPDVLYSMVKDTEGTVSLEGCSGDVTISAEKIVLKGVSVTYTEGGRTSSVTTDIEIGFPDINYALSQYEVSGIPEFAVIARKTLSQTLAGARTLIRGNAYVGTADLTGTGQLKIEDGTFIAGGMVNSKGRSTENGPRFLVDTTAGLWADTVEVGTGSMVQLGGKTYLANDLNLSGTKASAVLEGSYYGFGNSLTNSAKSSSIIANGVGSTLDITGLDRLILAGYAFIGDKTEATGEGTTNVIMGESVSVKPNQGAYLIPEKYLAYADDPGSGPATNPDVQTTVRDVVLKSNEELWGGRTLAGYGISVKKVIQQLGGQYVVYYFMEFDTMAHASEYFHDYFTEHPEDIGEYIERYITVTETSASMQTMGYTFTNEDDRLRFKNYLDNRSAQILSNSAESLAGMYANLKTTLSTKSVATDAADPYEYIVNTVKVGTVGGSVDFMDEEGKVVAKVVNGNYTYDSSAPAGLCLIVASGSVTVTANYEGLIICGENMSLQAETIFADEDAVVAAYLAKSADGGTIRDYLNISIEDEYAGIGTGGGDGWNVSGLVTLANWKKH